MNIREYHLEIWTGDDCPTTLYQCNYPSNITETDIAIYGYRDYDREADMYTVAKWKIEWKQSN